MRLQLRELSGVLPMVSLVLLLGTGCRITERDLETWQGTVKGPGKMVAVLQADKYDMALRTRAALGLVEMQRSDVDGVAELLATLPKLDSAAREQVVSGLVPGLVELMGKDKAPSADDTKSEPPALQIRAKDAAFALVPLASAETRKALTDAVMGWYVADFDGRSLAGAYSAEQVVRSLGASAASKLVDALSARSPQQALIKQSELIGQLGDAATKKRAAQKLVEIEREMHGEPFLAWLRAQIKEQLGANSGVDAARIERTVLLNRDKFIDEGVIPAMKYLAGEPEVAGRLLAIASEQAPELAMRRARALQALEGKAREEHLDPLLALALDPNAPPSVRDYAFDRVGDTRSPRAIAPMWPLVQDKKEQRLRWRAGELVLTVGGSEVLSEFFAKLPGGNDVTYEPEELEGYALRLGQMTPLPRTVAAAQLSSPDWWDRVIALHFFARKGEASDVAQLERLATDVTPLKGKGWQSGQTVGQVAIEAIAGLRERLGQGQAAQPN
jgi:hypothetical protein